MGLVWSTTRETFPPEPRYSVANMPNLSGKVMIVTGGYSGVGKETTKALLSRDAKVYIAGRSEVKARRAIEELASQTGKEAHFLLLDLADLTSVKKAAEEFLRKESQLHVLFNNAGVMACPIVEVTQQGYDMQFGVNVLGHFYFTQLLIPTLSATAKTTVDGSTRVITTSSSIHVLGNLNYATLTDCPKRRKKLNFQLYSQSKYGDVVFASELARRYGDKGIISVALNPGNIHSDLQRHLSKFEHAMLNPILKPTEYGALSALWAGTSAVGAYLNGEYVVPWARRGISRKSARDPKVGAKLWSWLEEQIARHEEKTDDGVNQ